MTLIGCPGVLYEYNSGRKEATVPIPGPLTDVLPSFAEAVYLKLWFELVAILATVPLRLDVTELDAVIPTESRVR